MTPPWFAAAMARAESLSLDDERDRAALLEILLECLPLAEMTRIGAETVRAQLARRNVHVDEALARDVIANAIQAMMGAVSE